MWRLIWAVGEPISSGGLGRSSIRGLSSIGYSSSSVIRRNTLEVYLWPQWYFLSQLKHKPFLRWVASSFSDSRLKGTGGDFNCGGINDDDYCELYIEGAERERGRGFPCVDHEMSQNFSSCNQAYLTAWMRVKVWSTWILRWICRLRPDMKQLRRKGGGRPITLFHEKLFTTTFCIEKFHEIYIFFPIYGSFL